MQCICFLSTGKKKQMWNLPKTQAICFAKYLKRGVGAGLPVEVNNPVSASQVRFQQLRVIERFCIEGSNKRSDRGAL